MVKLNTSFILSTVLFQIALYFLIDIVAKVNFSWIPKTIGSPAHLNLFDDTESSPVANAYQITNSIFYCSTLTSKVNLNNNVRHLTISNSQDNLNIKNKPSPLLLLSDSASTVVTENALSVYYNYDYEEERILGEVIAALKYLGSFMLDLFMIYFLYKTRSLYVAYASLFLLMIQKRNSDGIVMVEM